MSIDRFDHGIDQFGVGEHADLDRANAEILEARIYLRAQKFGRRHMHCGNSACVLSGQCSDRA